MSRDFHTLLVRIDPEPAKALKMIAAYEDTSMSELLRRAVDEIVRDRRRKKAYREMLDA